MWRGCNINSGIHKCVEVTLNREFGVEFRPEPIAHLYKSLSGGYGSRRLPEQNSTCAGGQG
jgi:hypothetical protein